MFGSPSWEPPLGWLPLTLAYLVVLAAAGVLLHRHLFGGFARNPEAQSDESLAGATPGSIRE
jgi:hypothetical protein